MLCFISIFPIFAYGVSQWQIVIDNTSAVIIDSPIMALLDEKSDSTKVSSINWGDVYPDSHVTRTFWIYNDHPEITVKLYMATHNWSPLITASHMILEWDREEYILAPKTSVMAKFTLTISAEVMNITSFSFKIAITGVPVD